LKTIQLLAKSSLKCVRGESELSANDVEEIPKGLIPGEWCALIDKGANRKYIAYVNPYADVHFKIKILKSYEISFDHNQNESSVAIAVLSELIKKSVDKRKLFLGYEFGARLVYGASDNLPGLIVDKYQKYIFIQINTAGLDRFREQIKAQFAELFPTLEVIFFDNEEYRKAEVLPTHEKDKKDFELEVSENNLIYKIPKEVVQKIGFYYDHRENRARLKNLLSKLNIKKEKGLDLFSYVGSWGLHLLSAGIHAVDFVDQANMQDAVGENLRLNNFKDRGIFIRSDVFKFLDSAYSEKKQYDVIVSDPPAFTKSEKNKAQAILGYEKLHLKAMKLLADEAVFVAASCTHYVDFSELDKTVQDAALKNGQKIQLLDMGVQGFDHPMKGFKDKSFYIKYLAYLVHRGNHE
jgi:23S rRNA (cytosine1962-C5)-methyltransferase